MPCCDRWGLLRDGRDSSCAQLGSTQAARRDCSFFVDRETEASVSLSLLSSSSARTRGLDQPPWALQLSAVVEVAEVVSSATAPAWPCPCSGLPARSHTQGSI